MHVPLNVHGSNYDQTKGADLGNFAKDKSLTDDAGSLKFQVLSSMEVPAKTHYAVGVCRDGIPHRSCLSRILGSNRTLFS